MTHNQINKLSNIELLKQFQQKARCFHSVNTFRKLWNEIHKRNIQTTINNENLSTEVWHIRNGEDKGMFDDLMQRLIKIEESK